MPNVRSTRVVDSPHESESELVGRLEEQGHVRRKASAEDGRVRNVVLQELRTLNKAMLKLIEANEIQDPADQ